MTMISKLLSTFFGLGYIPLAPGTVTSLAAVLLYRFWLARLPWPLYLAVLVILFLLGTAAATRHAAAVKKKDPRCIVIDETVGQLIPLFLLQPDWLLLGLAFLLFRFFDIVKPFPIRRTEAFPAGWGIMMDDVAAGLCAGIIINLALIFI